MIGTPSGPASTGDGPFAEVSASKIASGCKAAAALAVAASAAPPAGSTRRGSDRVDSTSLLALAASSRTRFLTVVDERSNVR